MNKKDHLKIGDWRRERIIDGLNVFDLFKPIFEESIPGKCQYLKRIPIKIYKLFYSKRLIKYFINKNIFIALH